MKKVIIWLLVLALTAAASIGATLAYLTDTDEDVNVMTIGKVKIDQLEFERIDTETADQNATVQEFHDNKPLLPAVTEEGFDYTPGDTYVDWEQIGKEDYTSDIWNPSKINNEIDKMVFVKNKGDYDAYVRSVFAFEAGNYETLAEFKEMVHLNLNETDWTWEWAEAPVTIGESKYFIATATYNKVLAPGALTEISLSQIALDSSATNADVEAFGETYQVLVKTQAIQADGFDDPDTALNEGFGEINENNVPWESDNPIKGIDLRTALHYLDGKKPGTKITSKVTNVIFGLNKEYTDIVDNYTGTLVDVEQDVPVYAYYVPNGNNYDVYFLANDTIYAPANSKNLFASMGSLKTVDTSNFDVSRVTNMTSMFDYCSSLQTVDTSDWDTSNVTAMEYAFYGCQSLTALDVSGWDMSNVTTMNQTFFNCKKLGTLDVSDWDVSKVDFFYATFYQCESLSEMDVSRWDTSSATNMTSLFSGCGSLTELDVSNWDVSNVGSFKQTFAYCPGLTELDVSQWDTSSATMMDSMFYADYNLEYLDVADWDVSKVTTFNHMFASDNQNAGDMKLQSLDLSKWNPVNATNMGAMLYGCGQLTALNLSGWNMPNLTVLTHIFADCYKLESIDLSGWQTPSLLSMDAMFNNCESLKTVNMSSFDTSNVKEFSQLFEACYALEKIEGLEQWDTSKGCTFSQMFSGCRSLKELDLSSFDTGSAYDNYKDMNNSKSNAFTSMFSGVTGLEKLIVSDSIVYLGNGNVSESNKLTFPAPASVEGSDGKWYDAETGVGYLPSEIPEGTEATYVAVKPANP